MGTSGETRPAGDGAQIGAEAAIPGGFAEGTPPEGLAGQKANVAAASGAIGLEVTAQVSVSPLPPELLTNPDFLRILQDRDIRGLFLTLQQLGFSQRDIAGLTGQGQAEVWETLDHRSVTSYDLLARIAGGLGLPPGLMGLAYVDPRLDALEAKDHEHYAALTASVAEQLKAAVLSEIVAAPEVRPLPPLIPVDHQGRSLEWVTPRHETARPYPKMVGGPWTIAQVRELRQAVRLGGREFGEHLDLGIHRIPKWEGGEDTMQPGEAAQRALDHYLRIVDPGARVRFMHALTQTMRARPTGVGSVRKDVEQITATADPSEGALPQLEERTEQIARVAAAGGALSISIAEARNLESVLPPGLLASPDFLEMLRARDITVLYAALHRHGMTQRRIAALASQSQNEISEIIAGRRVTSYNVLVRIADGLGIPRGLMGLAYIAPGSESVSEADAEYCERFAKLILQARIVAPLHVGAVTKAKRPTPKRLPPLSPDHQGRSVRWVLPEHGAKEPYPTMVGGLWTTPQIQALRSALGMTVQDFAKHVGVNVRSIAEWVTKKGPIVQPTERFQSALDHCLRIADPDAQERFAYALDPNAAENNNPLR